MSRRQLLVLESVVLGMISITQAADKPDPTGTWKLWFILNNRSVETPDSLKLELKDDKLTGAYIKGSDKKEAKIEDATFKDGEIVFSIIRDSVRKEGNVKTTTKYTGKLEGETIKFKVEGKVKGEAKTIELEARREKKWPANGMSNPRPPLSWDSTS